MEANIYDFGEKNGKVLLKARLTRSDASQSEKNNFASYCFILDQSGSMAGRPWDTIKKIIVQVEASPFAHLTTAITYAENSLLFEPHRLSDVQKQGTLGCTSFESALREMQKWMLQQDQTKPLHFFFMTDGEDNASRDLKGAQSLLKKTIEEFKQDVIINVIGFSRAQVSFLDELRQLGKTDGFLRYALENEALETKLSELLDFIQVSMPVTIHCSWLKDPIVTQATSIVTDPNSYAIAEWIDAMPPKFDEDGDESQKPKVTLLAGSDTAIELPVKVCLPSMFEYLLELEHRKVETLEDAKHVACELGQLRASSFRLRNMAMRMEFELACQDLLERTNEFIKLSADSALSNVTIAALKKDLQFDAKFSKMRVQRKMNVRIAENAQRLATLDTDLEKWKNDLQPEDMIATPLDGFSEDIKCEISWSSLEEIMNDPNDLIGFGLLVARGEHLLDVPTAIKVESISTTLMTRLTFEESWLHHMNNAAGDPGGGFSGEAKPMVVGKSREPINAWLPLFVNPAHARKARILLPVLLGQLVTLNPFGFDKYQWRVLYTIQASIIAQLADNERSRWIAEQYTMLCTELLPTLQSSVFNGDNSLQKFIADPALRNKSTWPNLLTVAGLALCGTPKAEWMPRVIGDLYPIMWQEALYRNVREHFKGQPSLLVDLLKRLISLQPDEVREMTFKGEVKDEIWISWFEEGCDALKMPSYIVEGSTFVAPIMREWNEDTSKMFSVEMTDRKLRPFYLENAIANLRLLVPSINNKPHRLPREYQWITLAHCLYREITASIEIPAPKLEVSESWNECHAQLLSWIVRRMEDKNNDNQVSIEMISKRILNTEDPIAFAAKLRRYAPLRSGKIFERIEELLSTADNLHSKLEVLLTNTVDAPHLEPKNRRGLLLQTVWTPPLHVFKLAVSALGKVRVKEIERLFIDNRAMVGHLYRESDIPNRHGHCNSRPNGSLSYRFSGYNHPYDA
jgi:hypothetical protein